MITKAEAKRGEEEEGEEKRRGMRREERDQMAHLLALCSFQSCEDDWVCSKSLIES